MKMPNMIDAKKRNNDKINYVNYNVSLDKFGEGKKFFVRTYGCQMNEHDSEKIKGMLKSVGYTECDSVDNADIVILNTCAIRENAHDKVFGFLGVLKHIKDTKNPDLLIGICGCMSQEKVVVDEILSKYKYVDFVCGTHNLDNLLNIIKDKIDNNTQQIEVLSYEGDVVEGVPVVRDSIYSAWVDIQYGCDKFCTYCIVPYTRGKQRSRTKESIIEEVKKLKEDGYKEVTLLGQNVNAYGKDLYDDYTLGNLLEDIAKKDIPRVRFMTSHPWDFTDSMVEVIGKYKNIMPSVHLPVQSGSSRILKLMGRRYTRESYLELFNKIKNTVPGVAISTDIIVGFPGETEEDFLETLSLAEECKYDNAFTFIFSKREGTPACLLKDETSEEEKENRLQRLNKVVNKYFLENNKKLENKIVEVLVEGVSEKDNMFYGYTDTNKLINFSSEKEVVPGDIIKVKVVAAKTWSLDGEAI